MDTVDTSKLDLSSLGSLDFTPAWARKDAGVTIGKTTPERRSDDRRPAGDSKGPDRDRKPGGDRKPFDRDRKAGGGFGKKPFDRSRPRFEERPKPLNVDVKILPETKALGTIIRKLQQDFHAYKLKDLAYFFLDNPQSVLLKITPKPPAQGEQPKPLGFHQCKACGFASNNEADVVSHIVAAHLGDYFDSKEVDCEPPKGNFNCVAKCGLSGVLLGPPNIHEFNATVREMIRTRYPGMTEEQYRSHIEMVRDPEAIEEWRKGAVKRTIFTAKGAGEGSQTYTREQAEAEFKRTILPSMLDVPKHLMITADVALKSPLRPLQWAAKDALEAERRAPYNMCFALRGAFHHRKMHFFRANDSRGPEFVIGIEPKAFDTAHAIPELAKVATFIAENPCSAKADIASDPEAEKHLSWLVSTGHVIAFTNGVYSAVEKFPKYGPQWRKKKTGSDKVEVASDKVVAASDKVDVASDGGATADTPAPEPAPAPAAPAPVEPEPAPAEPEPAPAEPEPAPAEPEPAPAEPQPEAAADPK